ALVFEDRSVSYAELNSRANCLATYLRKLGAGPEVRVGICLDRGVELMVALLGILKSGACYVPLDPHYPRERLLFILEDSAIALLVTRDHLQDLLPSDRVTKVCIDTAWQEIAAEEGMSPH